MSHMATTGCHGVCRGRSPEGATVFATQIAPRSYPTFFEDLNRLAMGENRNRNEFKRRRDTRYDFLISSFVFRVS
jgi:hypothetical protein